MTTIQLRSKLHQFIDNADEKKLEMIYKIVDGELKNKSLMTDAQKVELDLRLDEYMQGKGKNHAITTVVNRLRKRRKTAA